MPVYLWRGYMIIHICIVATVLILSYPLVASADARQAESQGQVTLLKNKDYYHAIYHAIDGAKREIVMSFFLFKTGGRKDNYPDAIVDRLIKAAKRGVRVELILERGKKKDADVDRENNATANRLKTGGISVCFDSPRKTTHTKIIVVDKKYTILGSHNLTQSALKYNNEISVMIDSEIIAAESQKYIRSLCSRGGES